MKGPIGTKEIKIPTKQDEKELLIGVLVRRTDLHRNFLNEQSWTQLVDIAKHHKVDLRYM